MKIVPTNRTTIRWRAPDSAAGRAPRHAAARLLNDFGGTRLRKRELDATEPGLIPESLDAKPVAMVGDDRDIQEETENSAAHSPSATLDRPNKRTDLRQKRTRAVGAMVELDAVTPDTVANCQRDLHGRDDDASVTDADHVRLTKAMG
jgi:hypothetical protein